MASAIARAHQHGPSRSVEGRKEAVAGRVDLGATVPREQATNGRVMALDELTPAPVAEFHGRRGRVHDVGEQHGRQHPIELGGLSLELTDERRDGVREIVLPPEVRTLEFDQLRAGDVVGEVGRVLAGKYGIARSVDDGRRDADRREDLTNVRRPVDLRPRERIARRARVTPEGRQITVPCDRRGSGARTWRGAAGTTPRPATSRCARCARGSRRGRGPAVRSRRSDTRCIRRRRSSRSGSQARPHLASFNGPPAAATEQMSGPRCGPNVLAPICDSVTADPTQGASPRMSREGAASVKIEK
jgi:hypothetical protein